MKEELDKQLCEKFPKLFAERNDDMRATAMCWGFEHGDGWFNIIQALCSNIQWHIDQSVKQHDSAVKYNAMREAAIAGDLTLFDEDHATLSPEWRGKRLKEIINEKPRNITEIVQQVTVNQVKEKFGTLRFYYSGGDDYIDGLVAMAESMSAATCEECGSPGRVRPGGWLRCQCDNHANADGDSLTKEDESMEP
jgi:hypothetical protein